MDVLSYFASATFVVAVAAAVFRLLVRREYERSGRLRAGASLAQLSVFIIWAYFAARQLPASWPGSPGHWAQRASGWLLFAGGIAATLAAIASLGPASVLGLAPPRLKVSGLYRISRNPEATAFAVALLGAALLWPTWRLHGALLLYVPIIHLMIRTEEEHLLRALGQQYREYARRVPRYLWNVGQGASTPAFPV